MPFQHKQDRSTLMWWFFVRVWAYNQYIIFCQYDIANDITMFDCCIFHCKTTWHWRSPKSDSTIPAFVHDNNPLMGTRSWLNVGHFKCLNKQSMLSSHEDRLFGRTLQVLTQTLPKLTWCCGPQMPSLSVVNDRQHWISIISEISCKRLPV